MKCFKTHTLGTVLTKELRKRLRWRTRGTVVDLARCDWTNEEEEEGGRNEDVWTRILGGTRPGR